MGIKFEPKVPKVSQTAQIAELDGKVRELQKAITAIKRLLSVLPGVLSDEQ